MQTDALINGIISFIIPGLGQAIEGYKMRGLILFIIAIIAYVVMFYLNLGNNIQYIFTAVYGLIVGYDAYRLY